MVSSSDYRNWGDGSSLRRFVGVLLSVLLFLGFVAFMASDANATGRGGDFQIGDDIRAYGGKGGSGYGFGGDGGDARATGVGVGTGVGIGKGGSGVGVGKGGDARASVRGVKAAGGNAYQNQYQGQSQSSRLRNSSSVGVGVNTSDFNSVYSDGGNAKVRNNTTDSVVIQGDSYEAPKKPDVMAYAPDVNPPAPTAPCLVPWGVAGGSGAALLSIGASGASKDHGCAFGEVARRAHAQDRKDIADKALELMFQIVKDEAGIEDEPKPAAYGGGHGAYIDPHAGAYNSASYENY